MTQKKYKDCRQCFWYIQTEGKCHKDILVGSFTVMATFCKSFEEQTQGHKRIS